jgi:hypothetical protein
MNLFVPVSSKDIKTLEVLELMKIRDAKVERNRKAKIKREEIKRIKQLQLN